MSRQHFKIGKGISLTPVASRPTDPENGDVIYNSTTNLVERYEDGAWKNSLTGAVNDTLSNLVSPTAINQDLIFNKTIALVKTADKTGVGSETLSVLTGTVTTTGSSGTLTLGTGNSASASGSISLISGSTSLTGATTGAVTIRSGNGTTGNTSSGAVTITTGTSFGTSVTGALTLQTGISPGLAGSGNITMNSGNVTSNTSGSSGVVAISSGTSVAGATGTTGIVSLASGNHASPSTAAGTVTVTTGTQTGTAFSGTGGVATVTTGNITSATATGTTGGTNILTGNTAGSGGATGAVTIRSGNATSTGNSGAVILQTGSVTTGVRGSINMVDASLAAATAGHVWTLSNSATGAGNWQPLSTTSGQNFIVNGAADNATASIFVSYQDTSGSRPADGAGGTTTGITTTITSTTPLSGTKSYLLTKDAANRQGGGWAIPFGVDPAFRAKGLSIDVDYIVNSGTFVAGTPTTDSDVIWYLYDITNSQLIEPSNIKMLASSTTISDKFRASFQTSATGSNYRLIAHIATTSASAYELKVDNVSVSPSNYVFGSPVTDWQSVTMTGNFNTNTVYTAKRARVGDSYKYNVQVSFTGTPNSTTFALNLPAGDVIDTLKLGSGSGANFDSAIEGRIGILAGSAYQGGVLLNDSTSVLFSYFDTNGNGAFVTHAAPAALGAGSFLNIEFTVPVVGLSSSVQMSDAADTRNVSVYKLSALPTGTINGGYNAVIWSSITGDTHGRYNTSTGRYTVPVSGFYSVTATLDISGTFSAGNYIGVRVVNVNTGDSVYNFWKAQTAVSGDYPVSASGTIYAKAGEELGVDSISSGSSLSFSGSLSGNHFAFNLQQGPSAIAASEKINAIYKTSSGQSLGAGVVIINFDTKEEDSHGLVTTGGSWKFTAQTNRVYKISGAVRVDTAARRIDLYKNGAFVRSLFEPSNASETESFNTSIRLNAGDFVDIRANSGTAASLFADDRFNYICVSAE